MLSHDDLLLLLACGNQFQSIKVLVKNLGSKPDRLLELLKNEKVKDEIKRLNLEEIKRSLIEKEISFLPLYSDKYSSKLKEIQDPPIGLFYRGNIDLLHSPKSVAVVGTRSATSYGLSLARNIASLLVENNVTVISGLAAGIDSSAHIGAIEKGATIAVLGTGPDFIYPLENKDLFYEILSKNSLIISEYPPGTTSFPWNFPQRNRIISALSDAVIVVEGDLQSGALITARFAIKQGKALFALPGPINSPVSNGPNILIKSGVAELLTSVQDILEKIGDSKQLTIDLKSQNTNLNSMSERQKIIYKFLSTSVPYSFDTLANETKLHTKELIQELSIMELKGLIEKTSDGGYVKV